MCVCVCGKFLDSQDRALADIPKKKLFRDCCAFISNEIIDVFHVFKGDESCIFSVCSWLQ